MTDEEIAEKYAKSIVIFDRDFHNDRFAEIEQAFLAGLKAGKPKLHKVADGDLPKRVDDYVTNIGVLTYDNYGNGVHKWHTPYCEACDYADEVGDDEVIAWCEIPKYTEE